MLAFSASSCLEKYPADRLLEEGAMTTLADAEQFVTGIYAGFKSSSLYGGSLTLCPDIQADLVYAVDGYSNNYGQIWLWDILNTDQHVEAVYASLYTIIGRCNYFLDNVDKVMNTLTDDDDILVLEFYKGEVYTARALCYSELLKIYCKAYEPSTKDGLGVVLRTKYYESEPAVRATLEESYKFVCEDLEKAMELLDEDYDYYNNAWFSAAAATALRARVALYMQDYDAAIKYSSMLLDREDSPFELADATVTYTSGMSYLDYMWRYDSSFEIIAKIAYTTTSLGGALGTPFLKFTTDYMYYYPDYVPAQWVLNAFDNADARYNAYFASVTTGYPHQLTWPLLIKYMGNPEFEANYQYHYQMPKIFRLAEQYLIRAEAYCHKGQYSKGAADLAALRSKRYLSGGGVSLSADNWEDFILNERMKELYMEGFRLHDLKRFHRGFERKQQTSSLKEGSTLKIEADNPLFVWPIPQHELESPGSMIKPNESNR